MRVFWMTIGLTFCLLEVVWATANGTEPVTIFVSIVPQKYFVEKIGGEWVKVSVMVEPGASPATYEPKPRQMVALSMARIYCAIGVPFERVWLRRIADANPRMLIVHTEEGIEKRPMKAHHQGEGDHGDWDRRKQERPEVYHGINDPHIWLSPPLVKIQSRNILDALLAVDPLHAALYKSRYQQFIVELDALDTKIRGLLTGKGEAQEFMVFHPAWGYFAHTYGLEQVAVEIEGKQPRPADLRRLILHARERGIKVVFVQPEFSTKSAETIAKAIEGQVVFASPLAPDWARNLEEMAAKVGEALRQ